MGYDPLNVKKHQITTHVRGNGRNTLKVCDEEGSEIPSRKGLKPVKEVFVRD